MLSVFSLSVNLFPFSSLYNLSASPSSRHIFLDYFYIFLQCYSNFSPSIYNATPTLILLASYYFLFPSVRLLFDSLNLPIAVLLSRLERSFIYCLLQFDLLLFLLSVSSMLSMLPMLFMLLMLCGVYICLFLVNVGKKLDLLFFVNRFVESILIISTSHSYFACLSLTEHGKQRAGSNWRKRRDRI